MARLIASIFLCGLFLTPLVASAVEPVKWPEFKFTYSRDRADPTVETIVREEQWLLMKCQKTFIHQ